MSEGGGGYVSEGGGYALGKGVGSGVGSGSEETSRGLGEGRRGSYLTTPVSRNLCSRGPSCLLLSFSLARDGRLRIGGGVCGSRSIVWVEGGRGES